PRCFPQGACPIPSPPAPPVWGPPEAACTFAPAFPSLSRLFRPPRGSASRAAAGEPGVLPRHRRRGWQRGRLEQDFESTACKILWGPSILLPRIMHVVIPEGNGSSVY
ncbi:unnamed protein product, partial [Bubo scandiacus]